MDRNAFWKLRYSQSELPGGVPRRLESCSVDEVRANDSSLDFDRRDKGSLYARAGIADYWIVNLVDRALEIYRDPVRDPTAVYGWRYRSVTIMTPPASAVPLAFASSRIAVADLLP